MKSRLVDKNLEEEITRRFYYEDGKLLYRFDGNRFKADTEAGTQCPRGYKRVSVSKKKFLVHRIIWFLNFGDWPEYLDHINRDKSDNRVENLRPCNFPENKRNVDYGESVGVRELKTGKWEAYTGIGGKFKYLGTFDSKNDAKLYRNTFLEKLYGEFHYESG